MAVKCHNFSKFDFSNDTHFGAANATYWHSSFDQVTVPMDPPKCH